MSRARGNFLQNSLADYLRRWWPYAESAGAGRQGTDVIGTPGVVWECKTATNFKADFRPKEWVEQSKNHIRKPGDVPVTVYYPPGVGAQSTDHALAIVPMHVLMQLLVASSYAQSPADDDTGADQGAA